MHTIPFRRLLSLCLPVGAVMCLLSACAVPVPPTGGPPDQKPPSVVRSSPENGTLNFTGREIEFEFDEAVDVRSFTSAFSISPDLNGPPSISGSGKRVRVRLPEDPRAETTYIVSLKATLKDVHGVVLTAPITIAFSTGSVIDAAMMSGNVVRALDGKPVAGVDVFAFASDDSLTIVGPPLYRTQTAKSGEFLFNHVAQKAYFVVAVRDANRNRLLDPGEAYGVPPVHFLQADSVAVSPEIPWVLTSRDNTPPSLERVRVVSPTELELRFSEPLNTDLNAFRFPPSAAGMQSVFDTLGNQISPLSLYIKESRSRSIFAKSLPLQEGIYLLEGPSPASDSSGNIRHPVSSRFSVPSVLPPAAAPEFMMWVPDSAVVSTDVAATESGLGPRTIWPQEQFGFRTTVPVDTLYKATLRDTSGTLYDARFLKREDNFFTLEKSGAFPFTEPFFVEINQKDFGGPDSVVTGFFRYATSRELGSLSYVIHLQPNPGKPVVFSELFEASDRSFPFTRSLETGKDSELEGSPKSVLIDQLPGGKKVFLRVYQGKQSSDRWWGGSIFPWIPAEPITWIEVTEPVRSRWETALPDTLDFRAWPLPTSQLDSNQIDSSQVDSSKKDSGKNP
jgi:hypothetical protein